MKLPFATRVHAWMIQCFGAQVARDKKERAYRFIEEALELVQACGVTAEEAHQLVDYTFNRPVGEMFQEVGGVAITLQALCNANDIDVSAAAEAELKRVWGKIDVIRAKQARKPHASPLPEAVDASR